MAAPVADLPIQLTVRRYTTADVDALPSDGNRYELVAGVLIVNPPPGVPHEVAVWRVLTPIAIALGPHGIANVVGRSEIRRDPDTRLEPDLLVFPAGKALPERWTDIRDWWVAVEVYSPSSRYYDRDTKRAAYLALGVPEVWLVDPQHGELTVWTRGAAEPLVYRAGDTMRWMRPEFPAPVEIIVTELFRGM